LKLRKVSAHRFEDQLNGHFWLRQCNQHSPLCAGYIAGFTRLNSVLAYPLFCLGDLRVAEVESVVAKELRRASTGSVSRNWSPAGLGLQPLLASWVWLAVQSTGCLKKRAAAVQGGDVRSGAERHDKLCSPASLESLDTRRRIRDPSVHRLCPAACSWTSEIAP
jgi:hypothetical protein